MFRRRVTCVSSIRPSMGRTSLHFPAPRNQTIFPASFPTVQGDRAGFLGRVRGNAGTYAHVIVRCRMDIFRSVDVWVDTRGLVCVRLCVPTPSCRMGLAGVCTAEESIWPAAQRGRIWATLCWVSGERVPELMTSGPGPSWGAHGQSPLPQSLASRPSTLAPWQGKWTLRLLMRIQTRTAGLGSHPLPWPPSQSSCPSEEKGFTVASIATTVAGGRPECRPCLLGLCGPDGGAGVRGREPVGTEPSGTDARCSSDCIASCVSWGEGWALLSPSSL